MTTYARTSDLLSRADEIRTRLDESYPDADELRPMTLAAINRLDAVIETGTDGEIRKETARGLDVLEALDRLEENKREAKIEAVRPMIVNLTDDVLDSILALDSPVRRDGSDFARYVLIAASRERAERRAERERLAAKELRAEREAGLVRKGARYFKGGEESGIKWAVFPGDKDIQEALSFLGWTARHGGAGMPYIEAPTTRKRGSRLLITQWFGWDI